MWIALVVLGILLVIVVAGIGGTYYYLNNEKLKLQREKENAEAEAGRAKLAEQQAGQKAAVALAKSQQDALLAEARNATNLLVRLMAEERSLRGDAENLKTNETGRAVALFPELVNQARLFYDTSLSDAVKRDDIVARLEGVRRIEVQLIEAANTAYEPVPEMGKTVQAAGAWGEQALAKVTQLRQALAALARESKIKFTDAALTPTSPTLAEAISKRVEHEASDALRRAEQTATAARTTAVETRAAAEAERIRAEAERDAAEVRRKLAEEQAAKEREWQEREARLKLEETKSKVAVQDKADEARRVELKKKASDPAIRAKLAPFITPGYVGIYRPTAELKRFSFQEIQSFGALAPTIAGQDRMVAIATAPNDKVRPHWSFNPKFYRRHADQIQMVQEAQQLLTELGPVLVELGLLEP